MSLNISTLKENLVQAFQSMKDGDDLAFAKKVSEAVANHIKTGNITTVDAGTVPVGVFAGAGTGAMTVDASILEGVLLAACKSMAAMSAGGNAVLAAQLAAGMDAMTNAGQIKTMITGAAVTPAGVSVPLAGSGQGKFTGVSAPIIAAVNADAEACQRAYDQSKDPRYLYQAGNVYAGYFDEGSVRFAIGKMRANGATAPDVQVPDALSLMGAQQFMRGYFKQAANAGYAAARYGQAWVVRNEADSNSDNHAVFEGLMPEAPLLAHLGLADGDFLLAIFDSAREAEHRAAAERHRSARAELPYDAWRLSDGESALQTRHVDLNGQGAIRR